MAFQRLVLLSLISMQLSSSLFAQQAGDKVQVSTSSAELKHGSNVVDTVANGEILEVEQVNGDWLWVKKQVGNEVLKGWINRKSVQLQQNRPANPQIQATATNQGSGSLWIGNKKFTLNHLLAYKTKSALYEDDPNPFTVVLATEKPVPAANLQKLKQSLEKDGTDNEFYFFSPQVKLTFDPDGGLMFFNGWADNMSLNGGGSGIDYEFTDEDGSVKGFATMTETQKFFDETYRFDLKFDMELFSSPNAKSPGPTKSDTQDSNRSAVNSISIGNPEPREFSAKAIDLPFPPDAQDVQFDDTFKDIEFVSDSPIESLAQFYRVHMTVRGWEEDADEAKTEEDEIDITFLHGDAEVVVELAKNSDGKIDVDLDIEELSWEGIQDPAALLALGIPQPRSHLFLQKEVPLPETAYEMEFDDGELEFKSELSPRQAADFYMKQLPQRRFQPGRSRPFLTDNLCTLEFTQGAVTLDVKIFRNPNPAGSRITIEYENETPEPSGPPLEMIAKATASPGATGDQPSEAVPVAIAIDFSTSKGSATVTYGGRQHLFKHAVAYQSENYGDHQVLVLFSKRPIPFEKMQQAINKDDGFSFSDLYRYTSPETFELFLSDERMSMSLSINGIGIGGHRSDSMTHDAQVSKGRISGSFQMTEPEEILSQECAFEANIDAPILRPSKWGPLDSLNLQILKFRDDYLLPNNVTEMQNNSGYYLTTARGIVPMTLPQVHAFYREQLGELGWQWNNVRSEDFDTSISRYTNDEDRDEIILVLFRGEDEEQTKTVISYYEFEEAINDGVKPEPGKSTFLFANTIKQEVTCKLDNKDHTVKPGIGAESPADSIKQSLDPGKYELTVTIPGQEPKTQTVELEPGDAWGVMIKEGGEISVWKLF